MIEDGSNYGDFLLKTIESAKDEFTEDELKLLQKDGETIRSIEVKVAALQEKFPGCGQMPSGDGTSVPAGGSISSSRKPPNSTSASFFRPSAVGSSRFMLILSARKPVILTSS